MLETFEARFNKAMLLRQENERQKAYELFVELLAEYPHHKALIGMLAVCCFELEQYDLAMMYGAKSVAGSPK